MPKYIPYSIRHNITDPDLACLLDYLERVMGWEMEDKTISTDFVTYSCAKIEIVIYGYFVQANFGGIWNVRMPKDIFFRTYKTLLPCIRDLYSK